MKKILGKSKRKWMEIKSKIYFKILYVFSYLGKVNKNKVVMSSMCGKGYVGNPKYICEELHKQMPNLEIVCLVENEKKDAPNYVKIVKNTPFNIIKELSTAKIWIDDQRKIFPMHKKKGQLYIQTLHGGLFSLKRIEKDIENQLSNYYIKYAKNDSKMADVLISDSDSRSNLYKRSFWYKGPILQVGQPRNDILYEIDKHQKIKKSVYDRLNLPYECKILLYTPTIRKKFKKEIFDINYDKIEETLERKFGGKWVALVKLHPAVANRAQELSIDQYNNVINVSDWEDLQELLIAADVLITDYSSALFDYIILEKKAFIFAKDMDEYEKERGHYFNFRTLPISISENINELENNILNYDEKEYLEGIKKMLEESGLVRGNASKKVVEWIKKRI